MALGFMKNVFTFGKDKKQAEIQPEEAERPDESTLTDEDSGETAEAATGQLEAAQPDPAASQDTAFAERPPSEPQGAPEETDEQPVDPWDDESVMGGVTGPSTRKKDTQPAEEARTGDAASKSEPLAQAHPEATTPEEEPAAAVRNTGFEITHGPETRQEPAPVSQPKKRLSWFQRLKAGLLRTSQHLSGQIAALFTKRKLDEDALEELEDLLIQADLGVETAMRITDTLSSERYGRDVTGQDVARIMAGEITKVLKPVATPLALDLSHKPHVILVVGVNGTGKTTTIGKLAAKLSAAGLKVTLGAGDTFRAAAIEQLKIWADRTGSEFVGSKLGADAAGLAFDAFKRGQENGSDVVIIDTAGRLQNKAELMDELSKIVRVLGKLDPDAPHTVLQTLDATTGQNAMNQVEIFRNVAGVSGLIMTKLDGTARGGILVAIAAKHKLPVYFIGVGEGIDDLEPFEAEEFAEAIAGTEEAEEA
ncbi:signal recognition particle-docking protein FtsY [Martelella mediterranea]|uniref:Signal recognition particle receptor FtsY n=1 Tax=Martelella mediterranea TaxID=293089 RepID=A0A4R3NWD2_9HYPH|nr:signal recognition particle-docking protein FtsY [Martelella mediterranea]TCT43108.1 signal recognition particle-docking protein FtsY [Martelella mediterranea]